LLELTLVVEDEIVVVSLAEVLVEVERDPSDSVTIAATSLTVSGFRD